jgi:hypothetical protein
MLKMVSETTAERHGASAAESSELVVVGVFAIILESAATHPAEAISHA